MATTYAAKATSGQNTIPPTVMSAAFARGKVRAYTDTITFAAQADGDDIVLFGSKIPKGSVFLGGVTTASATAGATATLAVGITGSTGKYRAAATHTSTAPTLFGVHAAHGVASTADEQILVTIAAAALPGSGTLTVTMFFAEE
jgi:hypothetical protein